MLPPLTFDFDTQFYEIAFPICQRTWSA